MSLLLSIFMLVAPPSQPRAYYYNGRHLVALREVELSNVRNAVVRLFVYSPYELRGARVDSTDAGICLPDESTRRELRLEGRWYTLTWRNETITGHSQHVLRIFSYHGKPFAIKFVVNVEGSEKAKKPSGVN